MNWWEWQRTGVLPITIRRCGECRRTIWPWETVGYFDPEDGSLRHHNCHHEHVQWFVAECGERDWHEWLWCNHRVPA